VADRPSLCDFDDFLCGILPGGAPGMTVDSRTSATRIVVGLEGGDRSRRESAEALFPLVYAELRQLARNYMRREPAGHTLQPTGLVQEAYMRLIDQTRAGWKGRTHFYAVGAKVMRRLLIDHARKRGAAKRAAKWQRVTLGAVCDPAHEKGLDPDQLLGLNDALEKLAALDRRQARIVTYRFFGGLTVEQVAEVLGVSMRTVEADWRHARAWLRRELSHTHPS